MRAKHIAKKIIEKLREDPRVLLDYCLPLLRGTCYALYFRLFRRNVRIRLPFYVTDRVHISGPGKVSIDWGCHVRALSFDRLNIVTLSPDAEVVIGRRCNFGPLIIRCGKKIVIGNEVMSANCLIQDTPFFTSTPAALEPGIAAAPINIGDGVWLSDMTMVLAGSGIGTHGVMSRGSVCHQFNVPENRVAFGNTVIGALDASRLNALLRPA